MMPMCADPDPQHWYEYIQQNSIHEIHGTWYLAYDI
jgi:hypothetical protein